MNRYQTGTSSWTKSTRTISSATLLSSGFESADATYQRQVIFRIGTSLYYGRVATYVSASSVTLLNQGSLPSVDGTIAELFILDLSENHSYADYINKVKLLIKDGIPVLSDSDIDSLLMQALYDYSRDVPLYVKYKLSGNGTTDIALSVIGSLWIHGYSFIRSIEYPFGNKPEIMLEENEYNVYDDGTAQDGSNLVLRFQTVTPDSSESFVIEFRTKYSLPIVGSKNFPDTDDNFSNICLLSASYCCRVLAAHYAQSTNATISADVVNYNDKTAKYTSLAKEYLKRYNSNVLGDEEATNTTKSAFRDKDLDLTTTSGRPFIFHGDRVR